MFGKLFYVAILSFAALCAPACADPVKVVAAENSYGDVASQIGGANVAVTSILTNPDVDPHLFEASSETARAIAGARVVVANGAGYDNWMEKLLSANKAPGRKGHRRGSTRRASRRRQSPPLVRSGLYEVSGQIYRGSSGRGRPGAQSRI